MTDSRCSFEMQFGTNHVAHFLLFDLVKDAMIKSSTPELSLSHHQAIDEAAFVPIPIMASLKRAATTHGPDMDNQKPRTSTWQTLSTVYTARRVFTPFHFTQAASTLDCKSTCHRRCGRCEPLLRQRHILRVWNRELRHLCTLQSARSGKAKE